MVLPQESKRNAARLEEFSRIMVLPQESESAVRTNQERNVYASIEIYYLPDSGEHLSGI